MTQVMAAKKLRFKGAAMDRVESLLARISARSVDAGFARDMAEFRRLAARGEKVRARYFAELWATRRCGGEQCDAERAVLVDSWQEANRLADRIGDEWNLSPDVKRIKIRAVGGLIVDRWMVAVELPIYAAELVGEWATGKRTASVVDLDDPRQ